MKSMRGINVQLKSTDISLAENAPQMKLSCHHASLLSSPASTMRSAGPAPLPSWSRSEGGRPRHGKKETMPRRCHIMRCHVDMPGRQDFTAQYPKHPGPKLLAVVEPCAEALSWRPQKCSGKASRPPRSRCSPSPHRALSKCQKTVRVPPWCHPASARFCNNML